MPTKPVNFAIGIVLGPLIDDTDFKTREESIAHDAPGMEIAILLEKADGSVITTVVTPSSGGDYGWTHLDQGYYELRLPASGGSTFNNNQEGVLRAVGHCTGVLPFSSVAYDVVGAAGSAIVNLTVESEVSS
jgi:hypothetical protein